jgi:hypothetical protein
MGEEVVAMHVREEIRRPPAAARLGQEHELVEVQGGVPAGLGLLDRRAQRSARIGVAQALVRIVVDHPVVRERGDGFRLPAQLPADRELAGEIAPLVQHDAMAESPEHVAGVVLGTMVQQRDVDVLGVELGQHAAQVVRLVAGGDHGTDRNGHRRARGADADYVPCGAWPKAARSARCTSAASMNPDTRSGRAQPGSH